MIYEMDHIAKIAFITARIIGSFDCTVCLVNTRRPKQKDIVDHQAPMFMPLMTTKFLQEGEVHYSSIGSCRYKIFLPV